MRASSIVPSFLLATTLLACAGADADAYLEGRRAPHPAMQSASLERAPRERADEFALGPHRASPAPMWSPSAARTCIDAGNASVTLNYASTLTNATVTYSCYPYLCNSATGDCNTTCAAGQCAAGYVCSGSACIPEQPHCAPGGTSASGAALRSTTEADDFGHAYSCGEYACNGATGRCFQSCTASSQCSSSTVCDVVSGECI